MKSARVTKDYHPFLISTLKDREVAANYLSVCIEDGDINILVSAFNNVMEALAPKSQGTVKRKLTSKNIELLLANPDNLNDFLSQLGLRLKFSVEREPYLKEAA